MQIVTSGGGPLYEKTLKKCLAPNGTYFKFNVCVCPLLFVPGG